VAAGAARAESSASGRHPAKADRQGTPDGTEGSPAAGKPTQRPTARRVFQTMEDVDVLKIEQGDIQ